MSNASSTRPDKLLRRWHILGACVGMVLGALATLPLILATDHHGTLAEVLWKIPVLWASAFLLASPLLRAILRAWFHLAKRYPSLEPVRWFVWITRVLVAIVIAVLAHALFSVLAAVSSNDVSWAHIRYRFVTDQEGFGLLVVAAVAWFVLPRVWIRGLARDGAANA